MWRFLDLGLIEPYESTELTEVLFTAKIINLIPSTVLVRVPQRYVDVGRRAGLSRVDLEYCRVEGIPVIREMGLSGGSVGIFDGNIIHCDLVSESIDLNMVMSCVVKGLQLLGLNAYVKDDSNDILVAGKKISGSGSHIVHGTVIAGFTLMMGFDYDFCERAIVPRPELFADKEASSHREWVTTLKAELGREVSYGEAVSALRRGFEEVLQIEFEVADSLTEAEKRILADLQEKYHSESWLKYGRWSPVKEYWRPSL